MTSHDLLAQQLQAVGLPDGGAPPDPQSWQAFLELVGGAYAQMDQEHNLLEELLESERERLQAIITALGDGLCTLDAGGALEYLNPEAERLLGWTGGEMEGQPLLEMLAANSDLFSGDLRSDARLGRREGNFNRQDGSIILVSFALTPILHGEEFVGAVLVFRDIGPSRASEEALQRAHGDLERQYRQLARVNEFFRSTLDHMIDAVGRGALRAELSQYLQQAKAEFDGIR